MTFSILDFHGPPALAARRFHAQADDLAIPLLEFGLQPGHVTQFRGAHRGEVLGVREQDGPAVADPLVEVDPALRSLGGEIGSLVVDAQHGLSPLPGSATPGFALGEGSGYRSFRSPGDVRPIDPILAARRVSKRVS